MEFKGQTTRQIGLGLLTITAVALLVITLQNRTSDSNQSKAKVSHGIADVNPFWSVDISKDMLTLTAKKTQAMLKIRVAEATVAPIFNQKGSHLEPTFTLDNRSAFSFNAEFCHSGTFEKMTNGWQWIDGDTAFRLGNFEAVDASGEKIALTVNVSQTGWNMEIGENDLSNAQLPVIIRPAGNAYDRKVSNVGLRVVTGWNGVFPKAQFQVNGQEVSAHDAANLLSVPESDWWRGCSPTSASMLLGMYDRDGHDGTYYDNLMPGGKAEMATLGGTGFETRLKSAAASSEHAADYYISFGSGAADPMASGRNGTGFNSLADFMGTSQNSVGNNDGYSTFYYFSSGSATSASFLAANGFANESASTGINEYITYSGYGTSSLYNQYVFGYNGNTKGFTLEDYQAEIDAGRPVLVHLRGHTMVGTGYIPETRTIKINNTWGRGPYEMTWGTSYEGMLHISCTVVKLAARQNTAPELPDSSLTLTEDTTYTFDGNTMYSLCNDIDGDDLTATITTLPNSGSLYLGKNLITSGTSLNFTDFDNLTYTPAANFNGDVIMTWKVLDHHKASREAILTLDVVAVNDPPTTGDDNLETTTITEENTLEVLQNDTCAPDKRETLVITNVSDASLGQVLINDTADALLYTPAGIEGTDTLSYTISDGNGLTATAQVIITLTNPPNWPPVAAAGSAAAEVRPGESISLSGSGSYDPDNAPEPLTYEWTLLNPSEAGQNVTDTASINTTFTTSTAGTYTFLLTVNDGETTDTAEVTVAVGDPLDLHLPTTASEGDSVNITISLPYSFDTATAISLTCDPANAISLPASVSIPADQTQLQFTANVVDDSEYRESTQVIVTATSTVCTSSYVIMNIAENDIPEIRVLSNSNAPVENAQPASAEASEMQNDFGSATVNSSSNVQTYTVRNTGTGPLRISAVVIDGVYANSFTVSRDPAARILAGDETTFDVTFTPSSVGLNNASVTIASNAPNDEEYTFDVEGTGAAAPVSSGGGGGCAMGSTNTANYTFPILMLVLVSLIARRTVAMRADRVKVRVPIRQENPLR